MNAPEVDNLLSVQYRLHRDDFVSDVDLSISCAGITAIFGASGSGKTTLLRTIAGLEKNSQGHIRFRDKVWQQGKKGLPVHKRPIGYVFQEASLFAHLNVRQNLEYGYRRSKENGEKLAFDEVVELLGLQNLLTRYSMQLSGGQRQRVAIARALLRNPQLLLMDEPLASLDSQSKAEILPYLESLHERLQTPILYVTHALDEIERIADRLVLLDAGRVLAQGGLSELLSDPALPLSHLDQASSVFEGTVSSHDNDFHLTTVQTRAGSMAMSIQNLPLNHRVRVRILARDVSIALEHAKQTSISNILPVSVIDFYPATDPAQVLVRLNANGVILLSRITRRSLQLLQLKKEMPVFAQIKSVALTRS